MIERNPFSITTPEGMPTKAAVDLFVDVLSDFPKVKREGHVFLHGARGTGKSMIFRFLMPDCQSVATKKPLPELEFFGVYVPVKLIDLKLGELMGVEGTPIDNLLNEHYMCLFVTDRLFEGLESLVGKEEFYPWAAQEKETLAAAKSFISGRFNSLLIDCGEHEISAEEIEYTASTLECCKLMRKKIHRMRSEFTRFLKFMAMQDEAPIYSGGMCAYLDFLLPLLSNLDELPFMPSAPIYLLMDDADNLNVVQTKILNSWVGSRTTQFVSIKVSTQLRYKTYHTAEAYTIEAPHDYSEINISTIYTNRGDYIKRVEQIIDRRLKLFGLEGRAARDYFPGDVLQEAAIRQRSETTEDAAKYARPDYMKNLAKKSAYSYSGFEQLAHISSGIVRNFLEPASKMYCDLEASCREPIRSIPASLQNKVIRKESSDFFFDTIEKLLSDTSELAPAHSHLVALKNLISFLGGLFHLQLMSDKSERRLFSFALSDEPCRELKEVLRLGVRLGFFHLSSIGNKEGTGRSIQYVMSRFLAPHFNLDPSSFSGYKFLTSRSLELAMVNPDRMLRSIKKRGFEVLDDSQLELPMGGDEEEDEEEE
jgi:hypothetical protein